MNAAKCRRSLISAGLVGCAIGDENGIISSFESSVRRALVVDEEVNENEPKNRSFGVKGLVCSKNV